MKADADRSRKISVEELRSFLARADKAEFARLKERFADDGRKGVVAAFSQCEKRLAREAAEEKRVLALYAFEEELARERGASVVCGLDEVGRGPLAGPLAVGAVVLPREPRILGIDDSKKLRPEVRERLAHRIFKTALASTVCFVDPQEIDEKGMTACLRKAFTAALARIEETGVHVDLVLLDGNPLHFDERECNVVKGDAQCASIAAASIIAKVQRDALMLEYSRLYPRYHFDSCKGYASAEHIKAIQEFGLSPIHRKSFCHNFLPSAQMTLF